MIKHISKLLKFKVIILAVLCFSVAVAFPQWRSQLKTQGYYGYEESGGFEENFDSEEGSEFDVNTDTVPGDADSGGFEEDFDSEEGGDFEENTDIVPGDSGGFEEDFDSEEGGDFESTTDSETDCTPDKNTGRKKCCGLPCGPAREPKLRDIEVDIDIVPCLIPNKIKIGSRGLVRVVIHGSKRLNVKTIDTGSILFAGAKPVRWHLKHVICSCGGKDLEKDMILVFRRCELNLDTTSTEAVLTGETLTGTTFTGTDTVEIFDCTR